MKTGTVIIISFLGLAAVGGIAYFLMSKSATPPALPPTVSTTSETDHGGIVSSLSGILNGLHISVA
jgi:hypothetical protein